MQILKENEQYIADSSWTCDIWTGLGQNEFAGITAHFYDKFWVLKRKVLDLFYFPERHTAENIAQRLDRVADHWGSKPFQCTTDSGANIKAANLTFLEKAGALPLSPTCCPISTFSPINYSQLFL